MQWIYHVPNLTRYFFCYCMAEAPLKVEKNTFTINTRTASIKFLLYFSFRLAIHDHDHLER